MAPLRATQLSELSDEMIFCKVFQHAWRVAHSEDAGFNIAGAQQTRYRQGCANGCGCRKSWIVDSRDGKRYGESRQVPDWWGIDGGFVKADFLAEWVARGCPFAGEISPARFTMIRPSRARIRALGS